MQKSSVELNKLPELSFFRFFFAVVKAMLPSDGKSQGGGATLLFMQKPIFHFNSRKTFYTMSLLQRLSCFWSPIWQSQCTGSCLERHSAHLCRHYTRQNTNLAFFFLHMSIAKGTNSLLSYFPPKSPVLAQLMGQPFRSRAARGRKVNTECVRFVRYSHLK